VLVPPGAVALALFWAADARCDSGLTDCSWGLEVLLILPVLARYLAMWRAARRRPAPA
jgi:hypothetical protein